MPGFCGSSPLRNALLASVLLAGWTFPGCDAAGGVNSSGLPDVNEVGEVPAADDGPGDTAPDTAPTPDAPRPPADVPLDLLPPADVPPADLPTPDDLVPADEAQRPNDVPQADAAADTDESTAKPPPPPECCVVQADRTVGTTLCTPAAQAGYTLFNPISSKTTYLLDLCGRVVHTWTSAYLPGSMVYLLADGSLLRAGRKEDLLPAFHGGAGWVQRLTWESEVAWEFTYYGESYVPHHDIEPMPNGNVLLLVWEKKTGEEAIAAGRDPALLPQGEVWTRRIVEIQPEGPTGGKVVWEWHLWDHLVQDFDPTKANYGVVADHPELRDINFPRSGMPAAGQADWLHTNSIRFNPILDQIVMSAREANEIVIIDHSTDPRSAAGHTGGRWGRGGDNLYRWGNPQAYNAGTADDRMLFRQHDAQWIPPGHPGEGHLLVFNNGWERPGVEYSTVDEIVPPTDADGNYVRTPGQAFGPALPAWSYKAANPTDFYARYLSGAQRQPNGNTLVCDGPHGTFFEVDAEGTMVWRYVNPVTAQGILDQGQPPPAEGNVEKNENNVFKVHRYPPDHPGLQGRDLTPGAVIEGP